MDHPRSKLPAVLAVLFCIALLGGVGVLLWKTLPEKQQPQQAETIQTDSVFSSEQTAVEPEREAPYEGELPEQAEAAQPEQPDSEQPSEPAADPAAPDDTPVTDAQKTAQATLASMTEDEKLWQLFFVAFPTYFKEIAVSLLPIAAFFAVFDLVSLHLERKQLIRIGVGLAYTYLGLVIFLTGVNVGFMPAGNYLGSVIAGLSCNWIIIPIGMLIGYFIVMAEPAVYVLMRQVEELTDGAIPGSAMKHSLSIGVAVSVGLAMIRVLTGISIFYLLVPGYAVAIVLSFFVPKLFTAIAFDSGGVASGPMATTFLLPFAMGACSAVGGNIVTDAFGVVAMVAMTPLITIQGLGLIYRLRTKHGAVAPAPAVSGDAFALDDLAIIDL